MLIRIKGGRVLDPGNIDGNYEIYIEEGKILKVCDPGSAPELEKKAEKTIDADGKLITPGLVDIHVHLREPGFEYKENIRTGCMAAVAGGFTSVCCMPNTKPVNDNAEVTKFIIEKAKQAGLAKVYPVGAITNDLSGSGLSEFSDLKDAGIVAVTDDGMPVKSAQLMRRALEYAKGFDLPVMSHCEELDLVAGGSMNEGEVSARMGLAGIPNISESIMVVREIGLAELTGSRVHIAHVSTKESVEAIRAGKKRGVKVTAETAPHYFTLTDEAAEMYETNAKMNPPLRSAEDRAAIREGLADGTFDAIATDHAPHAVVEKEVEFGNAPNGIIGLETSLSLGLKIVEEGIITLEKLVDLMSKSPAAVVGIESGLGEGMPADITIIDTELKYSVDADKFHSLGRNTPFNGWELKGRAVMTIVDGRIVYDL